GLRERVAVGVEALRADLAVQLVADALPALAWGLEFGAAGDLHGPVERDPGHDLGVHEVTARAAHLPDPLVGQARSLLEVLDHRDLPLPGDGLDLAPRGDVELELVDRGVAGAHR